MPTSPAQDAALGRLRAELSEARLAPYLIAEAGDLSRALARYYWNVDLCRAFYPVLHALEVALRNGIDRTLAPKFPVRTFDLIESWIDRRSRVAVHPGAETQIARAKQSLGAEAHRRKHGDLVAAMSLGFWIGLLQSAYDKPGTQGVWFWPDHNRAVFPAAAGETMASIRSAFTQVRHFRNRVFHHEPIWPKRPNDQLLKARYDSILTALRWLSPDQAALTARMHRVRDELNADVQIPLFRERLLGSIDEALSLAAQREADRAAKRKP
jgi:hypothetical protein